MSDKPNLFDLLLNNLKNNKIIAIIILLGVIIIAISQFSTAIKDIIESGEKINKVTSKSKPELQLSSLTIKTKVDSPTVIDLIVRNTSENTIVIHKALLTFVNEPKVINSNEDGKGPLIPFSAVYNSLIKPNQKVITIDLTQQVPPHAADRFLIGVGIGDDENNDGAAEPITLPGRSDVVKEMQAKAKLTLIYNEDQSIISNEFFLKVFSIANFSRIGKINSVSFQERVNLLNSKSFGEVSPAIALMEQIGDNESLKVLKELRKKDLTYLKNDYKKDYPALKEAYEDIGVTLPNPDQQYSEFIKELDLSIYNIENNKKQTNKTH